MSGRKDVLPSFKTISAGDMSQATLTSTVTVIQFMDDIGYQFTWSGSPVGTFQVQVSADYAEDRSSPPNITNTGHWVPLLFTYWDGTVFVTSTDLPTSVGSPIYVDLALLSSPYIRAVYTKISGTGTLTATITGKQV